jgi:AraC-like DNA-binding protein
LSTTVAEIAFSRPAEKARCALASIRSCSLAPCRRQGRDGRADAEPGRDRQRGQQPERRAANAGFRVGYRDASQFTREYKRLFGEPPMRDVERLRGAALERVAL